MRPLFLSIRVQVTLLTLLVTVAVAGWMYYSTQNALHDVLSQNRQVTTERLSSILGGVYVNWVRRSEELTSVLSTLNELAYGASRGDSDMVGNGIRNASPNLEVGAGASFIRVYDKNGYALGASRNAIASDHALDRLILDNASKIEPIHLLACTDICLQYVAVPILYHGQRAGWVATAYPLTDMLMIFGQVSNVSITLNPDASSISVNSVRLNPPQIPLPTTHKLYAVFDARQDAAVLQWFHSSSIFISGTGILVLSVGIWLMLYHKGRRFHDTIRALPMLATESFNELRERIKPRPRFVRDDIDSLNEALVFLSYQFEEHQEVKQAGLLRQARLEAEQVAHEETRMFIDRVARAAEEERHSLARDLHDELGQWQTALHIHLDMLRESMLHDSTMSEHIRAIDTMTESITSMHKALHRMMDNLHPESLEVLGLGAALEDMVATWRAKGFKANIVLRIQHEPMGSLDATSAAIVYRIVQEALTNAAKYANATKVQIEVDVSDEETNLNRRLVHISVVDDGQGFDQKLTSDGRGLKNIQDRIRSVGGTVNIESAPGKGTSIQASFEAVSRY